MTETSELTMTTERVISAPKARVFDAWLNPEMLARFMTPGPGVIVPKAANDPREGGRFDILMLAGEQELPHAGTYKEISPHDRLVFTWESPVSVDGSTVTLTFADADGGTRLTLTHVRFLDETTRDNHHGGWTSILDALSNALS